MDKVKLALLGVGNRALQYRSYAERNSSKVVITAVADPDEDKLNFYRKIGVSKCYRSWQELLDQPEKVADVAIICTPDDMHIQPAMKAIEKGYHIVIEKPLSPNPLECLKLGETAIGYNKVFLVAHVLRYTKMYSTLKSMVEEGKIGDLITVEHSEYVERVHQSHSYVRGNWANSKTSAPMILTKSCHDMDILFWLAGESRCKNISSFGSLSYFRADNAPIGAPNYCIDGCPIETSCPYHAVKVYVDGKKHWWHSITQDESREARRRALIGSPYGRCVFKCGNDVVDHQVASMEFENGVTAAFTMTAFSKAGRRTKLMGTKGELEGYFGEVGSKQYIRYFNFEQNTEEEIIFPETHDLHAGGDDGLMNEVVRLVNERAVKSTASVEGSVHSHMMSFAAEKARCEKTVVDVSDFEGYIKSK